MANRPQFYPYWTDGNPAKVTQPDGASALQGFTAGEPPPFQYVNYLFWVLTGWVQYLDQLTNTNFNGALIRLINGGNWSFNAASGALAWDATANLSVPSLPDSANSFSAGSVTLPDGYDAYLIANLPSQSLGDTSTSLHPDEIVNMNFTGNISVGDVVSGPGIPAATTVLGVAPTSVLLSQNVTSNNTQANYTFSPANSLSVQVAENSALIPDANTILIARRAGAVVYLGVNCAQMVLRDGEFKTLIGSGYFSLFQAPAGASLAAGTLVYISPGSSDGGRTAGALYPLDVSAPNQAIRGTYAGVVITAVSASAQATVLYSGFFAASGLTAGATYYADPAIPGGYTAVEPSGAGQKIIPVGFADSATAMLFTGAQATAGQSNYFPVFLEGYAVNTGDNQNFTLPGIPQSAATCFVYLDGTIIPNDQWQLTSATNLQFTGGPLSPDQRPFVVVILAGQNYLSGGQETATNPSGDRTVWQMNQSQPISKVGMFVYVDGLLVDPSLWTLNLTGSFAEIVFDSPLGIGRKPYVVSQSYFTQAGATSFANLGTGMGLYKQTQGGVAQFRAIKAGTNVAITPSGDDLVISASGGGGGGGGITAYGTAASPVAVDPTVGMPAPLAGDEVYFVTPTGVASGAISFTSTPQMAAGTAVGQRKTIFGFTNGSGGYFKFMNGNGIYSPGGDFSASSGQCLVYVWNGAAWQIVSNAI